MNDTPPAEDAPEFPGRQAALRLGGALLVVLFIVLVLTWRDNGHRAALETTAEFTSVGDAHYFPLPDPLPTPPFLSVAALHGQPLYPADYRRHEYEADDMARVGVDEKGGYILYQAPQKAKDADDRKRGPSYYLKISPKEYLKVRDIKPEQ
ncbi:MAG: hypothetical protein ABJF10_27890 [Chthoniobacter sp.]|uniref:hypothetical protein n=1 Tax=Chthoniobacter sp. TaxID=2510640 RepID=UPI0032ABAF3F